MRNRLIALATAALILPAAPAWALPATPAPAPASAPLSASPASALEAIHLAPPPGLTALEAPAPDMTTYALRHGQLTLHQGFGLTTLGLMAATGGIGFYQANVSPSSGLLDAHLLMAGATTALYLTTATLALTAPPLPLVEPIPTWSSIGMHRNLAWLHGAGMLTTVGLGLMTAYGSNQYAPAHGIAAASTWGLMALSALVIAIGE